MSETMYGLGCLPYEKDSRDYKFGDLISCAGNYPTKYISNIPQFRLNQLSSQMCVSFAIAMARYIYELNDSGNVKLFSPAYVYGNRAAGDYKGEGMMVRQALNGLTNNGICHNDILSYIGTYQQVYNKYMMVKASADAEAKSYRISSFYGIYTDDQIKQAIVSTGCAIVSYNVFDNWYNVPATGKMANNFGINHGAHCVLLVGWTENREWIILNSWGEYWGDNGLGYISMNIPRNEAWCMLDSVQEVFFKSLKDIGNHWAKISIDKAVQTGTLKGYEDGTFKPDNNITRAEACAIIAKLTGYDGRVYNASIFNDVKKDDWFFNYITWSYQHQYISGYTDGTFKPSSELTRAEACKILSAVGKLYVRIDAKTDKFSDVLGHWGLRWIATMVQSGYIKGYEDNTFRPDNNITRAEFITIIDRMGLMNK